MPTAPRRRLRQPRSGPAAGPDWPPDVPGRRQPNAERLVTDADLAAIWVTNPTAAMFGVGGPTKLEFAVYYACGRRLDAAGAARPAGVAGALPDRQGQDCFFQRHASHRHAVVGQEYPTARAVAEEHAEYIFIEDTRGFLVSANSVRSSFTRGVAASTSRSDRTG